MTTIFSTKSRNQRLIQTLLNVVVLLVSIIIPAIIFKIVLERTVWIQSINGYFTDFKTNILAEIFSLFIAIILFLYVILFMQRICRNIADIIAASYDNHPQTFSLSRTNVKISNRIVELAILFLVHFLDYSFSFAVLFALLRLALVPFGTISITIIATFVVISYDGLRFV